MTSSSFLIETDALQQLLAVQNNDAECVLPVFIGSEERFVSGHIPGSVLVTPQELVCGAAPAVGKLPDNDDLDRLFGKLNIDSNTIVVAYDDEGGGWAGRFIWTLDLIGLDNYRYLNGGIIAWEKSGLPMASGNAAKRAHADVHVDVDRSQLIEVDDILDRLGRSDTIIWDARSAAEFEGQKVLAAKGGHIPGAINIDWLELMNRADCYKLIPLREIGSMLSARGVDLSSDSEQTIITHCQTHHRSGLSYLVGKLLGLNIKAYHGSWSEWGNLPHTPVEV